MILYDSEGNVVAKKKDLESGGMTQDFESFDFDEPVQGSRVRLKVKGTTAGKWNNIAEVRRADFFRKIVVAVVGFAPAK